MIQKIILQIAIMIIGILLISCNHNNESHSNIESKFSNLSGSYLGQKPQGMVPEIFAPDIISTEYQNNSSPTFSADMNEVYWSISFMQGAPDVILFMKRESDNWSEPKVVSFSGKYSDGAPFLSPDNKQLFFHSNRPIENEGEPKDMDIWFVERTNTGWSDPINAGDKINTDKFESYPSVSMNGNLYFNSFLEGYPYDLGIYKSQLVNGEFIDRVPMNDLINSKKGFNWCPYIAPNEKYIIFSSGRDGQEYDDLYYSLRKGDDSWSDPVKFDTSVNSEFNDRFPSVSPDGEYIFFSRNQSNFRTYYKSPQTYEQLLDRYNKMNDEVFWVRSKVLKDIILSN